MTADEVLKTIEARRDPALKEHTEDDLVRVHYSEILVLEEEIDQLRAVLVAIKAEVSKGHLEGMAEEVLRLSKGKP